MAVSPWKDWKNLSSLKLKIPDFDFVEFESHDLPSLHKRMQCTWFGRHVQPKTKQTKNNKNKTK